MSQLLILRVYEKDQLIAVKQFQQDQIVIGSQADSQLLLEGNDVSAVHAMLENRGGEFHLCDLGSEAGTILSGNKILDAIVQSGDKFQIGNYTIEFSSGVPKQVDNQINEEKTSVINLADVSAPKSKEVEVSKPNIEEAVTPIQAEAPREVVVDNLIRPPSKATYAPKSSYSSLDEIIQPTKGSLVEVLVTWGDRVLTTYHCYKQGTITIGSHPKNDIIVPTLSSNQSSLPLLNVSKGDAKVYLQPFYTGQLYQNQNKISLKDLESSGKLASSGGKKFYSMFQGEMLRLDLGEGISIYIRYVSPTPKPLMIPFLGLTSTELTGIVIALVIGGLIYILSQIKPDLEEVPLEKEEIKVTKFVFTKKFEPPPPPVEKPKSIEVKPKKAKVKAAKETKALVKTVRDKNMSGGAASDARPNKSKSQKKILTSDKKSTSNNRRVDNGGVKAQKSKSGGTTNRKDIKNTGLLGAFARGGAQSQLAKVNQGAGAISGLSQSATGEAGSGGDGPVSEGLRNVGKGGNGTAKLGISGVGTQGRGGGKSGYGSGSLGNKQNANISIQSSDLESEGGIDREAILRVIRRNKSQILACYEKELNRQPNLYGTIKVNWDIGAGGKVTRIKIAESTMNNTRVEKCIMTRFKAWRFPEPPPNQLADISFPFVFTAK